MLRCALVISLLGAGLLSGQTTEGIIEGNVLDQLNLHAVPDAQVTLVPQSDSGHRLLVKTNQHGFFSFASLPPGMYRLTVNASLYRPEEVRNLTVPVSGLVLQNISVRLLTDIWQTGISRSVFAGDQSILPLYGPDVDLSRSAHLERSPEIVGQIAPSLSVDVSSRELLSLPLAGRDPYALVVLEPNVTNDVGTLRGLGVSANGQRPSSTEFLLDGFQNNNYLSTGVLSVLPPEAIQEYRLSLNNFSAEFGGTAGYLANVVTRASSNSWHALTYMDVTNQSWNAEDAQDKPAGSPAPSHQYFVGGLAGGAILKNRLFDTSSFEWDRSRNSAEAESYTLPTASFLRETPPTSLIGHLLAQFPGPLASGQGSLGSAFLRPTVSIDHVNGLQRLDMNSKDYKSRSFLRVILDRLSQPDFIWSPYQAFKSPLNRQYSGVGISTSQTPKHDRSYEFRVGYTQDSLGWSRAHPEVPTLVTSSEYVFGSPASYTFREVGKTLQAGANAETITGRHALKWGGTILMRSPQVSFSTPASPVEYNFNSSQQLMSGTPDTFSFPLSRVSLQNGELGLPQLDRAYRYWQSAGYLQDTYRLNERLLLHLGVRYEYYSAPRDVGTQEDSLIHLGAGSDLQQRISSASVVAGRKLYNSDPRNWAPRIGVAYNVKKDGSLILRVSYGIFYDRPFDNLWLNVALNDAVPASAALTGSKVNVLSSASANLAILNQSLTPQDRTDLHFGCAPAPISILHPEPLPTVSVLCSSIDQTFFQPKFRTPYTQSLLGGLQKKISKDVSLEVEYAGSLGHELVTTDILNRSSGNPVCTFSGSLLTCRDRDSEQFGDLDYRGNQGSSSHHALASSLLVRHSGFLWNLNYTWSHTIDNQSEPLAGFAANLAQANLSGNTLTPRQAAFTVAYDSSADRASSDFDIRHVLSSYFSWSVPSVHWSSRFAAGVRNWQAGGVFTLRSGSPFTVYALNDSSCGLFNNRSNLIDPSSARVDEPFQGGEVILNAMAFQEPNCGTLGNSGRNAFYGPGAYNFDVSLARTFMLRNERFQLTARVDAFNILNHSNLNNPMVGNDSCCPGISTFGLATYGRYETNTGLPVVTPLGETARQIHFIVRLAF